MLDKHIDAVHVATPQPPAHGHHGGWGGKPNKLVTPKLEIGIGPDKLGFWKDNWTMYKRSAKLTAWGHQGAAYNELFDDLFRTLGPTLHTMTETLLVKEMRMLAVPHHSNLVNIVALRWEEVESSLLRGQDMRARQCVWVVNQVHRRGKWREGVLCVEFDRYQYTNTDTFLNLYFLPIPISIWIFISYRYRYEIKFLFHTDTDTRYMVSVSVYRLLPGAALRISTYINQIKGNLGLICAKLRLAISYRYRYTFHFSFRTDTDTKYIWNIPIPIPGIGIGIGISAVTRYWSISTCNMMHGSLWQIGQCPSTCLLMCYSHKNSIIAAIYSTPALYKC